MMKNSYTYPLSVGLIVASILAILSWLALQEIDRKVAVANADKLQSVLDATEQAYHSWFRQQQADALIWAGTPEVQAFTKQMLKTYGMAGRGHPDAPHVGHDPAEYVADPEFKPQHIALESMPGQVVLRAWLKPVISAKGHQGYFVIAPDGTTLASSRHENIGIPNLLQTQDGFLWQVWAGKAVVSLPQVSDVLLPDESGALRGGQPTMFVAAPIRDEA